MDLRNLKDIIHKGKPARVNDFETHASGVY